MRLFYLNVNEVAHFVPQAQVMKLITVLFLRGTDVNKAEICTEILKANYVFVFFLFRRKVTIFLYLIDL